MKTSSGSTGGGSQKLDAYLAGKRAIVERALGRFLPEADEPPERLHGAMRYSVFSGGKRLRPILAIASFELLGGSGDCILAPACATEMIHTYSLIHDDLPAMDDDDTRRGRPTCHRAFDEATAILAGDALLTLAFEIVATEERLAAGVRLAIAAELARANGHAGMAGGQAADLEGETRSPSLEMVDFIHSNKTAKPIRAAIRVGAFAAGAVEGDLSALSTFGERIGMAFQIADDLLDVLGSEQAVGKAVRKDAARGKQTYPAVAGVEASRAVACELLNESIESLDRFGEAAWPLRAIARFVVERES
ncbi:MAG: polyprenyl synthetase family protein [Candidatus Eisenbacteria bacterium]|nr:polyprenyl synthetase family protein [Candidatus Eisenbacteria bacterium]